MSQRAQARTATVEPPEQTSGGAAPKSLAPTLSRARDAAREPRPSTGWAPTGGLHAVADGPRTPPELPPDARGRSPLETRFGHDFALTRVRRDAPPPVQMRLVVGRAGDAYEQEAERVAEQIVGMSEPRGHAPDAPGPRPSPPAVQRACASCAEKDEDEEHVIRAKSVNGSAPTPSPEFGASLHAARGGGRPLAEDARSFFEPRFGHDFSRVRIHTGDGAARMARSVEARAFTAGRDIFFGVGQYDPSSTQGRKLLAHELTHVVQQAPHIARADGDQPTCHSGHPEYSGQVLKPPLEIEGTQYVYRIWGTLKEGEGTHAFGRRVIDGWVRWRFGQLSADVHKRVRDYAVGHLVAGPDVSPAPNCQYFIPADAEAMNQVRILSGEVAREKEAAKQKKEEEARKAAEAAEAAKAPPAAPGGGEAEPKAGEEPGPPPTAPPAPSGQKKEETPPVPGALKAPPGEKQAEGEQKGGGYGIVKGAVEESKKQSMEPVATVSPDATVLSDPKLAAQYLKLLEHFGGRVITAADKTAAADGLTKEELASVTSGDPTAELIMAFFTQGYAEFKAAGGTPIEAFDRLEETIIEQLVRGNPTASHNQLKIGYSTIFPQEKNILGIVHRGTGELYYDADGFPLPAYGGTGLRDKGNIGSHQPEWGINIANIDDPGVRILFNALRQTFSDPMRMTGEAAEVYFNNVELVNAKVRQGLPALVWEKFKEMLPYFVGFLAGDLLASFLMRVPNPVVAGAGLALKVLLQTVGYVFAIDLAASALARLKDVAWHLSRVETNDKNQLTELSTDHIDKAAKPLRDIVADIALIAATVGFARMLRLLQSGKGKGTLGCNSPCEIKPGEGVTPPELKPGEVKPPQVKPGEPVPGVKPPEVKPPEVKPAEPVPEVKPPEVKPGEPAPGVKPPEATPEVKPPGTTPEVKPPEAATPARTPRLGDADYTGPQPPKSWTLADEGMGAHMIERQNVRARPDMAPFDQPGTPRYYPAGGPANAGQAHLRLHQATRGAGISSRGGNPSLTSAQLKARYRNAYADPVCDGIRGDVRTPDGANVIARNVTPLEAIEAIIRWGEAQAAPPGGAATPPAGTPPAGTPGGTPPTTP